LLQWNKLAGRKNFSKARLLGRAAQVLLILMKYEICFYFKQ